MKKNLAVELRSLIDVVKQMDFENKDLQNKISSLDVSLSLLKFIALIRRTSSRYWWAEEFEED